MQIPFAAIGHNLDCGRRTETAISGAERKAFAAEVGRIILKLQEKSKQEGESNLDTNWILDFADKSGLSKATAHNWWSSFCKETGLTLTPKQASDENRQAFFFWLDAQKQADEAEKAGSGIQTFLAV